MGRREDVERQQDIWLVEADLASALGHPFYEKSDELLAGGGFDAFVEDLCARFYAQAYGRPSLRPGVYFRSLLIGYFEGIEGERGMAWRIADSFALRGFLEIALTEGTRITRRCRAPAA